MMTVIAEQVDRIFAPWDRAGSPGCALGVVLGGELVYARGYGMANLDYDIPNTPTTAFHLASMSKQFTACALLMLAAEGRLSLDDELRRYVPETPAFAEEREAGAITLRQLLHHTSGLRDQFGLALTGNWRIGDVLTTGDVLGLLARQRELNFPPGSEMMYCNTGYMLLGLVIERLTGRPLREFCAERIFRPLGMEQTGIHDDPWRVVRQRAEPYAPRGVGPYDTGPRAPEAGEEESRSGAERSGERFVLSRLLTLATAGTCSVYSTVEDLAKWDANFYSGAVGGPGVMAQMAEPGTLRSGERTRYGGGLWMSAYRGLRMVEHDGEDGGYRCDLLRFPEQRFSVILLGNLSNLGHTELCRRVADLYLADAFVEPRPAPKDWPDGHTTNEGEAQGQADGHTTNEDGREISLGEYVGDYYSPELDSHGSFVAEEGLLFLVRPKHEAVPFAPGGGDGFAAGPAALRFTRDEGGRVNGFRVDFQGVRGLWYARE